MTDITDLISDMTSLYITERETTTHDPIDCLMESFNKLNIKSDYENENKLSIEKQEKVTEQIDVETLIDKFNNLSVKELEIKPFINEIIIVLTMMINKPSCALSVINDFETTRWIY